MSTRSGGKSRSELERATEIGPRCFRRSWPRNSETGNSVCVKCTRPIGLPVSRAFPYRKRSRGRCQRRANDGSSFGFFLRGTFRSIRNRGYGVGTICTTSSTPRRCGKRYGKQGPRSGSNRMTSGIASRPTCWRPALTSAHCRSCSVTLMSRPPKFTRTSRKISVPAECEVPLTGSEELSRWLQVCYSKIQLAFKTTATPSQARPEEESAFSFPIQQRHLLTKAATHFSWSFFRSAFSFPIQQRHLLTKAATHGPSLPGTI